MTQPTDAEVSERLRAKLGDLGNPELEAVARAIAQADGWTDWWDYLDLARAAIIALDEVRGR